MAVGFGGAGDGLPPADVVGYAKKAPPGRCPRGVSEAALSGSNGTTASKASAGKDEFFFMTFRRAGQREGRQLQNW